MSGIGGIKRGPSSAGPFQNDHNFDKLSEPGRHAHGEHDGAISKILGFEQRNKGRTSKIEYDGKPPMTSGGEYETDTPQPTSKDSAAGKSRP